MSRRQPLRPGEVKILTSLLTGDKTNTEIKEETKLHPSILSEYLKTLQKNGLVRRDVERRTYKGIVPISLQVLFFNEILRFIRERLEKSIKQEDENEEFCSIGSANQWVLLSENLEFKRFVKDKMDDPEIFDCLSIISNLIEDSWRDFILSRRSAKDRKIIEDYRRDLSEIPNLIYPSIKDDKEFAEELFSDTRYKLIRTSGVVPTDGTIQQETERRLEEIAATLQSIMSPQSLHDFYSFEKFLEKYKITIEKKILTEEDRERLALLMKKLKHKENRKIYEGYLKRISSKDKTMLIYPSWGFKEYPQKLNALLSSKEKLF